MWSGLHWMSLCVIPWALDGLLSSKVTLIIPISLNRALCLWGVGAGMGGIKQVCVSKIIDLLLFLTGMCLQIAITTVWFICRSGKHWPAISLKIFTSIKYLLKYLFSQHCLTEKMCLISLFKSKTIFFADWPLYWQRGKWSPLPLHM